MKNVLWRVAATHSRIRIRIAQFLWLLCRYSDPYGYCPFMEITVIYFVDKIVIEFGLTADLHTDHCLEWVHYYFGYSLRQKYYVGNIIRGSQPTSQGGWAWVSLILVALHSVPWRDSNRFGPVPHPVNTPHSLRQGCTKWHAPLITLTFPFYTLSYCSTWDLHFHTLIYKVHHHRGSNSRHK